ncbi:MAG: YybH family protein [Candidatus Methylomirabilaceae bacterium]
MITRVTPRAALAALLLAVGCARGGPLSEADKSALRANDQKYAEAGLAKNWAAAAAMYTAEASFMPPNGPEVKGPAMIQAWWEAQPPISTFTLESQEIDGRGDLAYARGTYTMSFTLPGAPAPIQDRGKFLTTYRKQADGSWLITNDIFNSDVPLLSTN